MNLRRRPATAIVAIVLAGAVLTACGDKDDSATSSATSSATDSSTKATPAASDSALTKRTFFKSLTAAQLKAGSAHMTLAIGAGGQTVKADGDLKIGARLADNSVAMTMDIGQAGIDSLKMVLIGDQFYLNFGKITDNKYAKIDLTDKDNPLTKQFGSLLDQMDPSAQFKQLDTALKSFDQKGSPVQIDGVKTQPYQIVVDTSKLTAFAKLPSAAADSIPATLTYVMYVGPDSLVRRITYDIAGSKSQIDYSKWGEPVDIKAPAAGDVTHKDIAELFGGAPKSV